MKIAPLMRAIASREAYCRATLVHTGQHYDREMSDVFFEELEIPKPDFYLDVGSGSHAEQTAKIMLKFEEVCAQLKPDCVVVVGDVNSTLACSIVAKKQGVAVAHVEAGLRSGDRTMPEEINRLVTDSITDVFFTTEESASKNLLAEGVAPERIHFVGHVMIDNLFRQLKKLNDMSEAELADFRSSKLLAAHSEFAVVTLHRPSNVDDPAALRALIEVLANVANTLPIVFPVHPRTRSRLTALGVKTPAQLMFVDPMSYLDFLNLWSRARLVITDSGGLQEETTALGVQCITVRDNTERPITVDLGTNTLAGTDPSHVAAIIKSNLNGAVKAGVIPPKWDGMAATRIIDALIDTFGKNRSCAT